MIKPSSGGFDMDITTEYLNNHYKRIKELEQKQMKLNGQCIEYIRKIDKLEQELEQWQIDFKQIYNDYQNNCKELERCKGYKICTAKILCGYKKEFEETKV